MSNQNEKYYYVGNNKIKLNKIPDRDQDVEYVVPVYQEPQSGLRLVATDEITVRFKSGVTKEAIDNINKKNGVEIAKKDDFAQINIYFG